MYLNRIATPLLLLFVTALPLRVEAQAFTEFRDPLRGVTFYSVQISTDPLTDLQVEGSRFAANDRMTLGFSAFFFDESDVIDDYVIWLRHEGPRRWFTGSNNDRPLRLLLDDESSEPMPLHVLPPGGPDSGPFVEKLEFALPPPQFLALMNAESAVIELTTLLGLVEKRLDQEELAAIQRFNERVHDRHDEAKATLAAAAAAID